MLTACIVVFLPVTFAVPARCYEIELRDLPRPRSGGAADETGGVQKRTLSCAGCNWTRWFPRGLTGETALPGLQERGRLAAEGLPAEFGLTCPREWYDLLSRD